MRHHIDELLLDIWRDPAQKKALTRLAVEAAAATKSSALGDDQLDDLAARGGGVLLVNYARAMLNSLMYMLGVCCQHTDVCLSCLIPDWHCVSTSQGENQQQQVPVFVGVQAVTLQQRTPEKVSVLSAVLIHDTPSRCG